MDKGLIIRIIVSVLAWANTTWAVQGVQVIPIGDDELYLLVSIVVTFIVFLWTGWKNNNFTQAAKEAQEFLKNSKIEKLFNKIYSDNRMDDEDILEAQKNETIE